MTVSFNDLLTVLAKILLLSAAISIAIKFLPILERIPNSSTVALLFVLTPPILLAILLAGRWRSNGTDSKQA